MNIKHIIFAFAFLCAGALHAEDQSWVNSLWQQLTELASTVVEKTKQIFTTSSVPATAQDKVSEIQAAAQDKLDQVGQQVVSAVKEIKEDVQAELSKIGTPAAQVVEEKIIVAEQPMEKVSSTEQAATAAIVEKTAPKMPASVTVTEGIEDIINKPTTKHPTDESKSSAVFTQADKQDLENQLNTQLPAQIKKPESTPAAQDNSGLNAEDQQMLKELANPTEEDQKELLKAVEAEVAKEAEKLPEDKRKVFIKNFDTSKAEKPAIVEEEIMLIEPLSTLAITKPEPELIIETIGTKTVSVPVTTPTEENRALMKELESLSEVEKANVIE